ncbi:MAG TPA: MMPL family transporter [Actinomycetota bacterium]|nr:MMPL family transporter [Actinomycetota bacterium]
MRLNPESLARASSRHPWRTIGAWLAGIVAMGAVSAVMLGDVLTDDLAFANRPEAERAQEVIDERFAGSARDTEFLVVSSATHRTDLPAYAEFVTGLQAEVGKLGPQVVAGPVVTYVEAQAAESQLFTPDLHGALILVQSVPGAEGFIAELDRVVPAAAIDGYQAHVLSVVELMRLMPAAATTSTPDPPEAVVLVSGARPAPLDPMLARAVKGVETAIARAGGAELASPPFSGFDAVQQAASLVAADGTTTLVPVPISEISAENVEALREVASRASNETFRVQVAGQAALFADMMQLAEEDMRSSEAIGLMVALVVLIVVFGSIVAAVLPIVMSLFAIGVALGLVALVGQLFQFNLFAQNIITMVGLAVGIDYSLFIVSRYREERKKGFEKLEAIGRSGATANRAVFFSGLTVVLALLGMLIIPVSIFRSLSGGAILVTLAALAASMTLLPAILSLLGDRVNWPRLAKRARVETSHDPQGGFWDRMTRRVMARPVVFLIGSVLILGSLGAFYFQLHRGTTQNVSALPEEFPSRQAFLTLVQEFDSGGVTDPAQIVLTGEVTGPQAEAAVKELQLAIAEDPAFSDQTLTTPSEDGTALMVSAYFSGDPTTDAAFEGIRTLRSEIVPATLGGIAGIDALVGGNTAFFVDFLSIVNTYQWVVLIFVLGLSFMLLTIVFRSLVVPAKAIVMNLLSVAAAYGAVTLVFQKGVGLGFFNAIGLPFERVEAIEAWLPLFLFSILFGLSMDYHVFLLTRIREEYDKTGDNTEAVAYGLRTTAGIITGAALIMMAVFSAFATGRLGAFQQMGFGLAVAVFLDATIVRTILVPASMRLLGDWNWYLPRWLQWLPQLRVEGGESELPVAPQEPVRTFEQEVRPQPRQPAER